MRFAKHSQMKPDDINSQSIVKYPRKHHDEEVRVYGQNKALLVPGDRKQLALSKRYTSIHVLRRNVQ